MREARILLPKQTNDGRSNDGVRKTLVRFACQTFGGATVSTVEGAWVDPKTGDLYEEPSWAIDVAGEATEDNDDIVLHMGRVVIREGEQLAAYVRTFSGDVQIISA